MASVVPVLTGGVIVLNGYTNGDIAAHLAGEVEETARPLRTRRRRRSRSAFSDGC